MPSTLFNQMTESNQKLVDNMFTNLHALQMFDIKSTRDSAMQLQRATDAAAIANIEAETRMRALNISENNETLRQRGYLDRLERQAVLNTEQRARDDIARWSLVPSDGRESIEAYHKRAADFVKEYGASTRRSQKPNPWPQRIEAATAHNEALTTGITAIRKAGQLPPGKKELNEIYQGYLGLKKLPLKDQIAWGNGQDIDLGDIAKNEKLKRLREAVTAGEYNGVKFLTTLGNVEDEWTPTLKAIERGDTLKSLQDAYKEYELKLQASDFKIQQNLGAAYRYFQEGWNSAEPAGPAPGVPEPELTEEQKAAKKAKELEDRKAALDAITGEAGPGQDEGEGGGGIGGGIISHISDTLSGKHPASVFANPLNVIGPVSFYNAYRHHRVGERLGAPIDFDWLALAKDAVLPDRSSNPITTEQVAAERARRGLRALPPTLAAGPEFLNEMNSGLARPSIAELSASAPTGRGAPMEELAASAPSGRVPISELTPSSIPTKVYRAAFAKGLSQSDTRRLLEAFNAGDPGAIQAAKKLGLEEAFIHGDAALTPTEMAELELIKRGGYTPPAAGGNYDSSMELLLDTASERQRQSGPPPLSPQVLSSVNNQVRMISQLGANGGLVRHKGQVAAIVSGMSDVEKEAVMQRWEEIYSSLGGSGNLNTIENLQALREALGIPDDNSPLPSYPKASPGGLANPRPNRIDAAAQARWRTP